MPRIPIVCSPEHRELRDGLDRIRDELEIPRHFPDDVHVEAMALAGRGPEIPYGSAGRRLDDRTDLPLVTIDPPSSMDLDQAYAGERTATGWRVSYAIADVAGWVPPGSAVDEEARNRGLTMYSPDMRTPLHPVEISEGAASLLPNQERQSLLWTIDLDDAGLIQEATLQRALVRSRAKLSYREAGDEIERGASPVLDSLREIGLRREALEIERGAVSLNLAQQEVVAVNGSFALAYDEALPVEGWNAQISLLTGIAAAELMIDAGVGIVRTLPPPDERTIRRLRRTAKALGVDWPKTATYAEVVRGLDPSDPREAALIAQSARGLRGAGYEAFDGAVPDGIGHSAIASDYAHVTAPLRRLGDRFANECVLAACAGTRPPDWVLEALPELPSQLGRARNKEGALDRLVVDLVEAALLSGRVGDVFEGVVTDVDAEKRRSRVQLLEPAVVAHASGVGELGAVARLKLTEADIERRIVKFDFVD